MTRKKISKEQPAPPKLWARRESAFALLRVFGISRLEAGFEGSYKNGDITALRVEGLLGTEQLTEIDLKETTSALGRHLSSVAEHMHDFDGWFDINSRITHLPSLAGLLASMCYDLLEAYDTTWRYDEGSSGEITIIPAKKQIRISMDVRVITSENHKAHL